MVESKAPRSIEVGGTEAPTGTETLQATEALSVDNESDIEGLGLFATEDIPVGEVIGITHVWDERFKDNYIRTATGAFLNHSDSPNIKLVTDNDMRYGKALRHIKKGEELSTQYTLYSLSL